MSIMTLWRRHWKNFLMIKRYFHEVIEEEQEILNIGLKQSRLHKKERLDREKRKTESEQLQDELEPIDD